MSNRLTTLDYEHFNEQIILDFENMPPKSLKQLAYLMRNMGYNAVGKNRNIKLYPTERQLELAWDDLRKEGIIETYYREHRIIILPSSYNRGGKTIKFKRHQVRDTKTGKILKWIK